jgi:hypothetical protein
MGYTLAASAQPSKWWQWLVGVVLVIAVVLYARAKGGQRASASFYETAAQIIPVLIVALAVEQPASWETLSWAVRIQVVAALLVGEVTAVLAVALGKAEEPTGDYIVFSSQPLTDLLSWLSVLSLAVGFVGVLWITLLD